MIYLFIYRFVCQTSEQDIKKIREEENDELREKVQTLEQMAEVGVFTSARTKYVQLMEFTKSSFVRNITF